MKEKLCINLFQAEDVWRPTIFGKKLGELMIDYCILNSGRLHGNVLELGIGSGLLSILAKKMGADNVVGLDINKSALSLANKNWLENGLDPNVLDLRHSDLFGAMNESEKESFCLLISNPPTFPRDPENRFFRKSRYEWEFAGKDGRQILDAVISQGNSWLSSGGALLTIATSTQGWEETIKVLSKNWKQWAVFEEQEIPLAQHYDPFLPYWIEKQNKESFLRVFKRNGLFYQKLYFIRAIKK